MKKNGTDEIKSKQSQPNEQTAHSSPLSSRDHDQLEVAVDSGGAVLSPLCRSDCKICNSDHAQEIHDMLSSGEKYLDICEYMNRVRSFSISPASISRHMRNFNQHRNATINRKFLKKMDELTDDLARNKAQASYLGNLVFHNLIERIELGTIQFDVSDWEKIIKLQHGVLNGDGGAMDDLLVIFAKASRKMGGASLEQGSLPLG